MTAVSAVHRKDCTVTAPHATEADVRRRRPFAPNRTTD